MWFVGDIGLMWWLGTHGSLIGRQLGENIEYFIIFRLLRYD